MKDDLELLRSYAASGAGEPFTELVHRHTKFVYSCALRRVGNDSHLAEDVTQRVFIDLARKNQKLSNISSLPGWLYVSAHLASADLVRRERRRKVREEKAFEIDSSPDSEPSLTKSYLVRVGGVLDDLIVKLKPLDREALVLRFFAAKTYGEVAQVQRTTEEGARKRVARALERLRLNLERLEIRSSAEILEQILSTEPENQTPPNLANRVAGIALIDFGAAGVTTSWLLGLVRAISSRTIATAAAFLAGVFLIGWQHHQNSALQRKIDQSNSQSQEIRRIQSENVYLTRVVAQAEDLRRVIAETPVSNVAAETRGRGDGIRPLNIGITADGEILWEGEPVTLKDFVERLVAVRSEGSASERALVVHGDPGSGFSATAYVVEQASKAGFKSISVDSLAAHSGADGLVPSVPSQTILENRKPPEIPDVVVVQ